MITAPNQEPLAFNAHHRSSHKLELVNTISHPLSLSRAIIEGLERTCPHSGVLAYSRFRSSPTTAMIIITVQPLEGAYANPTNINRKNSFPKALVYSPRGSSLFLALNQ